MLTRASKSVLPVGLLYDRLVNKFVNGDMSVSVDGSNSLPTCWKNTQNSSCIVTGTTVDTPTLSPEYKLGKAAKLTVTQADTVITAEKWLLIYQALEGYRHRSLKPVTNVISFYARSNKLGTYNISLRARKPGYLPSFVSEFTITKNMEYERFVFIVPSVDTQLADENDWTKDNTASLEFTITLMAGANYITNPNIWTRNNKICSNNQCNFADAVGNTFEVTGISIEANDNPSPIEVPDYTLNKMLVNRYYQKKTINWGTGSGVNLTDVFYHTWFPEMRVAPSVTATDIQVMVGGNNIAASFYLTYIDTNQILFTVSQYSQGIVRHNSYTVKATLTFNSLP